MLFAISGPSGSGKSTIVRAIMQQIPSLRFSISATTRAKRPKERDGVDYHFLTRDEFLRRIDRGELVEWEEIFGNHYGTLTATIDEAHTEGTHVLFDIDIKGALAIRARYPLETVLIFIQPPDVETLHHRLKHRATDDESVIATRLARATMELDAAKEFDSVVINDDVDRAIHEVATIIRRSIEKK